jgi:tetratricopeptide (TPR) repeat protein
MAALLIVGGLLADGEEENLRVSRQLNDAYRESFAPPGIADDQTEQELQDLIDKVNAISLPEARSSRRVTAPQRPDLQAEEETADDADDADAESPPADEPDHDAAEETEEADTSQDGGNNRRVPAPVLEAVTARAPERMVDPLRVADALFASGHRTEAYTVYKRQLENSEGPDDQAWLVYQMANCLAESDRPRAIELYRRVIAEFPDSPWAPLAQSNKNLLEWMDANRPREFLQELAAGFENT